MPLSRGLSWIGWWKPLALLIWRQLLAPSAGAGGAMWFRIQRSTCFVFFFIGSRPLLFFFFFIHHLPCRSSFFFFAHPLSRLSHKRRRRRNAINSPCWLNFLLNNEVFVSNEKVINEISSFVTSALADLSTRKRNQSKVKERWLVYVDSLSSRSALCWVLSKIK